MPPHHLSHNSPLPLVVPPLLRNSGSPFAIQHLSFRYNASPFFSQSTSPFVTAPHLQAKCLRLRLGWGIRLRYAEIVCGIRLRLQVECCTPGTDTMALYVKVSRDTWFQSLPYSATSASWCLFSRSTYLRTCVCVSMYLCIYMYTSNCRLHVAKSQVSGFSAPRPAQLPMACGISTATVTYTRIPRDPKDMT